MAGQNQFERDLREIHGDEIGAEPVISYRVIQKKFDPLPGWPIWLRVLVFGPLALALLGFIFILVGAMTLFAFFVGNAFLDPVGGYIAAAFMLMVLIGALAIPFIKRAS